MEDFWEGKDPCWIVLDCSKYVYPNCPAYQNQEKPCWEHEFTNCEKLIGVKRKCTYCKVFKLYNSGKNDP